MASHQPSDRSLHFPKVRSRAALLSCALSFSACAGAHFDGRWFNKRDARYAIASLPPEWQRVEVEGSDLAFHRREHGTISANATCREYDDVPAPALVNHLLFGTTDRRYVLEEEVTLDGRDAQHVIVDCELDGVPVRAEIYLLARNGCVFDLSYISGVDAPAHDVFTGFAKGFKIERAGDD